MRDIAITTSDMAFPINNRIEHWSLKVTSYSLFVTFNCTCTRTILYGLWTDAISPDKYIFLNQKLVTNILYVGQCRAWWSHFKNISCCNITEAKSHECVEFYWTRGYFSKTERCLPKKRSVWPLSKLKTINLDYCSLLPVVRLVRFWFKSLQSLTAHDRQFLQGNLFLLAVCTHDVPPYLCFIFCSCSLVQFSTASYRVFEHWTCPKLYLVTLRISATNFNGNRLVHDLDVSPCLSHLYCSVCYLQEKKSEEPVCLIPCIWLLSFTCAMIVCHSAAKCKYSK